MSTLQPTGDYSLKFGDSTLLVDMSVVHGGTSIGSITAPMITDGTISTEWSYAIDLVSVLEAWAHAGQKITKLDLNTELFGKYGSRTARFEITHEPLLDLTDQPFQVHV